MYYLIKFLPRSYLPTWITISTPIYYLSLLFIGLAYLIFRLFRRLSKIKENTIHNDLWRGTKEKKDAYMTIFFLTFIFFVVFFDFVVTGSDPETGGPPGTSPGFVRASRNHKIDKTTKNYKKLCHVQKWC